MFDLQVLAFQTDLTRVITFMLGPEQSNRTYPEIGVPEVHHGLSHHQGDPGKLAKLAQIDAYHTKLFRYYLERRRQRRAAVRPRQVISNKEAALVPETFDPIAFELFKNAIFSIADEMALTIFRTTYSGVLKDNMDYSTGFCRRRRPAGRRRA